MCACVLRNYFADHFLLSSGHGAGPGPSVTAGSDVALSLLHIPARFPRQGESTGHCPGHSSTFCHASIPSPAMGKTLQCPCPHQGTAHSHAWNPQLSPSLEGTPTALSLPLKMPPLAVFLAKKALKGGCTWESVPGLSLPPQSLGRSLPQPHPLLRAVLPAPKATLNLTHVCSPAKWGASDSYL